MCVYVGRSVICVYTLYIDMCVGIYVCLRVCRSVYKWKGRELSEEGVWSKGGAYYSCSYVDWVGE